MAENDLHPSRAATGASFASGVVVVLPKRSTKLTVGTLDPAKLVSELAADPAHLADWLENPENPDLPCKCDILVTEILDSALLGEGMVPATRDAWTRLLTEHAQIVPEAARILCCVASCKPVAAMQDSSRIGLAPDPVEPAAASAAEAASPHRRFASLARNDWKSERCAAGCKQFPMHTAKLGGSLSVHSRPAQALSIDFRRDWLSTRTAGALEPASSASSGSVPGSPIASQVEVEDVAPAVLDTVVFWWEARIGTAPDGTAIVFTTKPRHAAFDALSTVASGEASLCGWPETLRAPESNWQDHWTECIQPLPAPLNVSDASSTVRLTITASDVSLSFAAALPETKASGFAAKRSKHHPAVASIPVECHCGMHTTAQPDRIAMLAHEESTAALAEALEGLQTGRETCRIVDVADHGWTGLLAASMSTKAKPVAVLSLQADALGSQHVAIVAKPAANRTRKEECNLPLQVMQCNAELVAQSPAVLTMGFADVETTASARSSGAESAAASAATEGAAASRSSVANAVVSDLFHAQMLQKPSWQAASFWAQCRALHAAAVFPPGRSALPAVLFLRCAAISLPQMRKSLGTVGSARGLKHAAFDASRAGYERSRMLSFPLWMYATELASAPITMFALDCCAAGVPGVPSLFSASPAAGASGLVPSTIDPVASFSLELTKDAQADALVVWVEMDLTGESLVPGAPAPASPGWGLGKHPSTWLSTAWERSGSGASAAASASAADAAATPVLHARQELRILSRTAHGCPRLEVNCKFDISGGTGLQFDISAGTAAF
jgi:hypothetical protein